MNRRDYPNISKGTYELFSKLIEQLKFTMRFLSTLITYRDEIATQVVSKSGLLKKNISEEKYKRSLEVIGVSDFFKLDMPRLIESKLRDAVLPFTKENLIGTVSYYIEEILGKQFLTNEAIKEMRKALEEKIEKYTHTEEHII